MSYYDDENNVEQYIQMADGYDGRLLIDILRRHVPDGSSVLELGMGPGKDLLLLDQHYTVTGSDHSTVFVDRFRQDHPDSDLMQLDAVTMDTDRQFDAIYSNKVLYHLTRDQLTDSFRQQLRVLNPGGVALHSFWYGESDESMHGLHFAYYTETTLRDTIGDKYEIIEIERYTEMEPDDSLYVVVKRGQSDIHG